jgi:hypothetical protein
MSKAEIDFRGKITRATKAMLAAESLTSGKTEQELVRDFLHELSLKKIHAAKVLTRLAAAEGVGGADGGKDP